MGVIFSRYRKEKSTEERLEKLQQSILSIDHDLQYALQRQKVVGRLVICSVTLYIIIALVVFLFFFPPSMRDRIIYVTPLLIFPLIIFFVKRFVTWLYKRDVARSQDKLADLLAQKKKTLEEVMNKETYKKAKEILEKYAPEQTAKPLATVNPVTTRMNPPSGTEKTVNQQLAFSTPLMPSGRNPLPTSSASKSTPVLLPRSSQPLPRKLVRPIFPPERGYLDRIVEALIGDGPNRRYALICKHCASHNGMAMKDEFEYLAFRCVYCGCPNPAKKVRPRHSFSFSPQLGSDLNLTPQFSPQPRSAFQEDVDNEAAGEVEASSSIPEDRKTIEADVEKEVDAPEDQKLAEAALEEKPVNAEDEIEGDDKKNR